MKKAKLSFLYLLTGILVQAQNEDTITLHIGDQAPALQVDSWLKGPAIDSFQRGRVYLLDFWATWCHPCVNALPHLSQLQTKYGDKLVVVGIDVYEDDKRFLAQAKHKADSISRTVSIRIAKDEKNRMVESWIHAADEAKYGIPRSFIVDQTGKLAWIGHPAHGLDSVIEKIMTNDWNVNTAKQREDYRRRLEMLDDSAYYSLIQYEGNFWKGDYFGKPDSALMLIERFVKDEPGLKYTPHIAFRTFKSLLIKDAHAAYEYGKEAVLTSVFDDSPADGFVYCIDFYSDKLALTNELYQLGIKACQVKIALYPDGDSVATTYKTMAAWYWHLGRQAEAKIAQQKAIEALKRMKKHKPDDLVLYESRLKFYKKESQPSLQNGQNLN